jgi:hypothetical protein
MRDFIDSLQTEKGNLILPGERSKGTETHQVRLLLNNGTIFVLESQ